MPSRAGPRQQGNDLRHWDGKAAIVAEAVQKRQCESLAMSTPGPSVATCSVSWRKLVARWPKVTAPYCGRLPGDAHRRCLATLMREQVLEGKRISCDAIVSRAVERGELAPTANGELIHEILPSMLFMRILVTTSRSTRPSAITSSTTSFSPCCSANSSPE